MQRELTEEILKNPKFMFGTEPKSLDEERYVSTKRMQAVVGDIEVMKPENFLISPEKLSKGAYLLQTLEPSHLIKTSISVPMVISVLQSLGTSRHQELIAQVMDREVMNPVISFRSYN